MELVELPYTELGLQYPGPPCVFLLHLPLLLFLLPSVPPRHLLLCSLLPRLLPRRHPWSLLRTFLLSLSLLLVLLFNSCFLFFHLICSSLSCSLSFLLFHLPHDSLIVLQVSAIVAITERPRLLYSGNAPKMDVQKGSWQGHVEYCEGGRPCWGGGRLKPQS